MGCVTTGQIASSCHTSQNKVKLIDCRRRSSFVSDTITENVRLIAPTLSSEQVNDAVKSLSNTPLFSSLQANQLTTICSQMVLVESECGTYLFKQGDPGGCFFLIQQGIVDVEVNGKLVSTLKQGESFGELALLFRSNRAASIISRAPCNRFFVMKPDLYKKTLQHMRMEQYVKNANIVDKVSLFQCLTNKQKYFLSNNIKSMNYAENQIIFREGDVSQALYIISQGKVKIQLPGQKTISLNQYEMFGERSLRSETSKRAGTVIAETKTICAVIGKKDIEKMLGSSVQSLIFYNTKKWCLMQVETFKDYSKAEMDRINMAFISIYLQKTQKLEYIKYKGLVINLEGILNGAEEGKMFHIQGLNNEEYKGQQLIKNTPGYVGFLSFSKLNEVIRSIQARKNLFRASQKCIPQNLSQINLKDFEYCKKLGEGQFGQVYLVKNPNLGNSFYALKCLSKQAIRQEAMEESAVQQRKILQASLFPYIVGYVKAFHDSTNLYFLMQYIHGKEMFDVIREITMLSKPMIQYYFGCLFLSIEYLHARNIIYRDLKPQNSVVDSKGKVYLIDMGTAKQLKQTSCFRTFTIIGTPHYMAPQVLEGKGYSFEADYWSLGVLFYQLACGKLPFGETLPSNQNLPMQLYTLLKTQKLEYPRFITNQKLKDVIQLMLVKNPKDRLQSFSFEKVKKMPYFQGFNWDNLLDEKIIAPYIPKDFKRVSLPTYKNSMPFLAHIYGNQQKNVKVSDWDEEFV